MRLIVKIKYLELEDLGEAPVVDAEI